MPPKLILIKGGPLPHIIQLLEKLLLLYRSKLGQRHGLHTFIQVLFLDLCASLKIRLLQQVGVVTLGIQRSQDDDCLLHDLRYYPVCP